MTSWAKRERSERESQGIFAKPIPGPVCDEVYHDFGRHRCVLPTGHMCDHSTKKVSAVEFFGRGLKALVLECIRVGLQEGTVRILGGSAASSGEGTVWARGEVRHEVELKVHTP